MTTNSASYVSGWKLANKRWEPTTQLTGDGIEKTLQLQIKRARIRVEILKKESDPHAKYELFQRLNTGGSQLSEQEIRNCVAVMLNRPFYEWLNRCATDDHFLSVINQTETASRKQAGVELALRYFVFRNVPYQKGLDVHEYLDSALVQLATDETFSSEHEEEIFKKTFCLLDEALGKDAFKKWDGERFSGMFLMSVFEVMTTGVSKNLEAIQKVPPETQVSFITQKAKDLWNDVVFTQNSGAGVRGTTRLANLLPLADKFFRP